MTRNTTDVIRSLAKYLALALGPDWEIRFAMDEGTFKRPFARVTPAGPMTTRAHGAFWQDVRRTYSIVAFPAIPNDVSDNPIERALLEAEIVADRLTVALTQGVHVQSYRNTRGHPLRLPLYDTTGITLAQPIPESARLPNDFLKVDAEPSINAVPDPNDDRAYIVTAEIRLWWSRSTAVPSLADTVQAVTATPEG